MPRRNQGPRLKFLEKRGGYYIIWYERGRERSRSTGSSDRAIAEIALADFIRRSRRPHGPVEPHEHSIMTALENYAAEHGVDVAAPERLADAIEALGPFWGTRTVGDVTAETCQQYGRQRGRKPGTIRRELGVLRAAINHEHRRGRITRPVFVYLPPPPDGKDVWLTRSQAAALLWAARHDARCRDYLPLFIEIGLRAGGRKASILELRWPQVNLDRERLDFNPPGRRRTGKGRPIIPISRKLRTFLRLAKKRGSDLGYVVNDHGEQLGDVKRAFATAAVRAGMFKVETRKDADGKPVEVKVPTISPHTLRHTCGTWLAQKGTPMFEIAGFLGHTYERTVELYAHHHPDFMSHAKEAMG